jgi:hypothetical protein
LHSFDKQPVHINSRYEFNSQEKLDMNYLFKKQKEASRLREAWIYIHALSTIHEHVIRVCISRTPTTVLPTITEVTEAQLLL